MDLLSILLEHFHFTPHQVKGLSVDSYVCLIQEDWLRHALQGGIELCPKSLDKATCEQFLAASLSILPPLWRRIRISCVQKSDHLVHCLPEGSLYHLNPKLSFTEIMAYISRENYTNLWQASHSKYQQSIHRREKPPENKFTDVFRQWIMRLHPLAHHDLDNPEWELKRPFTGEGDNNYMINVAPVLALFESSQYFFVFQPYYEHSLQDIVHFSPALFASSHAKLLFVTYQLLQILRFLHERGLTAGDLKLQDVCVTEKLWLYMNKPQLNQITPCHIDGEEERYSIHQEREITKCDSAYKGSDENLLQSTTSSTVTLKAPLTHFYQSSPLSKSALSLNAAQTFLYENMYMKYTIPNISSVVDDWVNHKLSNFQYLMILNYLAGRRMNDPNNHPVLPWIMDFSHPDGGYRDLSMSKYRLNKGDRQLDIMYESIPLLGSSSIEPTPTQTPHHVSDVLSDITYYVYKARVTPKNILCAHVRTKWVPNEYPSSMQRLQDWTPDECIPEFFTDPTVFTTIHDDLSDLEVPPWCYSPRDFVEKHLAVLESDHISCRLHNWIDLTFGFKLSSEASVKSKNVYLHLVDQHTNVTNHGVVQLFDYPHPSRSPSSQHFTPPIIKQNVVRERSYIGPDDIPPSVEILQETQAPVNMLQVPSEAPYLPDQETRRRRPSSSSSGETSQLPRPENSTIRLPPEYDPLSSLDQLEEFYNFTINTLYSLPPSSNTQYIAAQGMSLNRQALVSRDMQALGCLLAEIFFSPMLRMTDPTASLISRYTVVCKLYQDNPSIIPRPIRNGVLSLLELQKVHELKVNSNGALFIYDEVSPLGLPPPNPSLLLNPSVDLFPFPPHFPDLYECLYAIEQKDYEIEKVKLGGLILPEKLRWVKVLAREKVALLEKFLTRHHLRLSGEEQEIILPYIEELFHSNLTSVQAAWHLFSLISKAVGPKEGKARFLKYLTTLLSGEDSTPKHMKLYHRVFLIQIIIWFGLETFLTNFSTLLVEAVAGYKDFVFGLDGDLTEDDVQQVCENSDIEPNSFTDPEQTDSDSDGENNVSMVTAFSQQQTCEDGEEDFPDNLSLEGETGDEGHSASQEDSLSESSEIRGSQSSLQQESESDTFKYGIGSVGKESIHSLSRLITHSNMDTTIGSDLETQESQVDENSVFESPPSFTLDSESETTENQLSEFHTPDTNSTETLPYMVRSETDEFRSVYRTSDEQQQHSNICDVASDSIKWLSGRLGPLLTAKYLSRNLIRMLGLCYLGVEQLEALPQQCPDDVPMHSCQLVAGDRNVWKLLDCLGSVVKLYGERVVLSQFFPCILDMISVSKKRMTIRAEAGLIGAVVLLRHATQYLSDSTLMDILQDMLIQEMLLPLIKLASLSTISFPSGPLPRAVLCYKIVDVIYLLGLRIGFEMTRKHMTILLQKFFSAFDVHSICTVDTDLPPPISKVSSATSLSGLSLTSSDDTYLNIKMDSETQEYSIGTPVSMSYLQSTSSPGTTGSWRKQYSLSPLHDDREEPYETKVSNTERTMAELKEVFSPELAFTSYIPLCRIFGSIHIEQYLKNDDLIRHLCAQHDQSLAHQNGLHNSPPAQGQGVSESLGEEGSGEIGSNVAVIGNRIELQEKTPDPVSDIDVSRTLQRTGILAVDQERLRCLEMDLNTERHLKGNWLAYWEHELGLSERDTMFNFKQIKLQTFLGHSNSIRAMCLMNNENSFVSASKDKTVKVWSLRSHGDGSAKDRCRWSYAYHKKSVFSVVFVETLRYMASCDSTVHIWDPFTSTLINKMDSSRDCPVLALTQLPAPNPHLMTATTDGTLRFLDLRAPRYAHEYRCTGNSSGLIRCVTVSPNSDWVAVGYSTGLISILDLRTGLLMGAWKGHDGEILQIKAFNKHSFVTSSFDQTMKLWKVDDGKDICHFKGPTEPVHCINFFNSQLISATTANKVGVHSSVDVNHSFSSTRLRSDTFKGVLTCMNVLPLNRALLLGADNGTIKLLC